jgi:hypothetical protein
MKVKLARALKEKNRLVGEINRLRKLFERENSRLENTKSTSSREKIWKDLENATDKLVQVKTAIFLANAGVYQKIVEMGELKSFISWLECVPTSEDSHQIPERGENGITYMEVKRTAFLNQEKVDSKILDVQKLIAQLQDEIDEYNATVAVEIPSNEIGIECKKSI